MDRDSVIRMVLPVGIPDRTTSDVVGGKRCVYKEKMRYVHTDKNVRRRESKATYGKPAGLRIRYDSGRLRRRQAGIYG